MDKMRFIVFSFVLSLFTVFTIHDVKAEEMKFAYVDTQCVNLSECFSETSVESRQETQKDTYNRKMKTENLILRWSFGITVVLLVTYLSILLRKYKLLKKHEVCHNGPTIDKVTVSNEHSDIDTNDIQNEAINMFRNIDKIMCETKPYLNTDFSRDTMIRMFNTNKNKLNEAIIAGSGMSYSKYICELRLQESIRIMEDDSDILLNDLAIRCGFNTYSSFYRSFYKRFGMSPADYRIECKKIISAH